MIDEADIPNTLKDWLAKPSKKLDTIAKICRYHLEGDNRAPLELDANEDLVPKSDYTAPVIPKEDSRGGVVGPDKIIIFSFFASNIVFIGKVRIGYAFHYNP